VAAVGVSGTGALVGGLALAAGVTGLVVTARDRSQPEVVAAALVPEEG
jgi:hypothetical protein